MEELGFKAIFLSPGCVNRRPWHHPAYDPLWAEIERLDVPLTFHGGGQTYLTPDFGLEVLDELMLWHTFSQPLGIQFVTVSPLRGRRAGALPEPALWRCSRATARGRRGCSTASTSTTSGSGWYEAHRPHDEAVATTSGATASSASSRRGDRATHYIDRFGDDNLVFSTDYPHGDSQFPHAVDAFDKLPMSDETKVKICGPNWSRLYKIPLVKKAPR